MDELVFNNCDSGFFSCCWLILYGIINYYNDNKILPNKINTTRMFNIYKNNENVDIMKLIFEEIEIKKRIKIPYKKNITASKTIYEAQFSDYKLINYEDLMPIINNYFTLNKNIIDKVKILENKYNISYENSCLIFYRGNDKITETTPPSYIEIINKALEYKQQNPQSIFFVQTDEYDFLQEVKKHIPDVIYFEEIPLIQKQMTTVATYYINNNNKINYLMYYVAAIKIFSNFKNIICTSGNGELFLAFFRGHSNGITQFLKRNKYIHGTKNIHYNSNEVKFWL